MDQPKLTVEELAALIKKRYPEYRKLSDQIAVDRFLEVFPSYRNQLKKKVDTKESSTPLPASSDDASSPSPTSYTPGSFLDPNYKLPEELVTLNKPAVDLNPFNPKPPQGELGSSLTTGTGTAFHNQLNNIKSPLQQEQEDKIFNALKAYHGAQGKDMMNTILTESQKPQEIVQTDAGNYGSKVGYVWNEFLRTAGGIINQAGDVALSAAAVHQPAAFGFANDAHVDLYRKHVSPIIREGLVNILGAQIDKGQERKFDENWWLSSVGMAIGSIPAILTGPAGLMLQGMDGSLQSIENADIYKQLDTKSKTIFSGSVGYVALRLEQLSLNKIFKDKTPAIVTQIVNKVFGEIDKSGKQYTGDMLTELLETNVRTFANKYAKFGTRVLEATAYEGATGASQEAATVGAEWMTNVLSGKQIFDMSNVNTWGGFVDRVADAGARESVGGAMFGLVAATINYKSKNNMQVLIDQLYKLDEQINNPDLPETAQEVLIQEKIKVTEKAEKEAAKVQEEQDRMTPEEKQEAADLNKKVGELDQSINDPSIPDEIKAPLIEVKEAHTKRLNELNEEVSKREQPPLIQGPEIINLLTTGEAGKIRDENTANLIAQAAAQQGTDPNAAPAGTAEVTEEAPVPTVAEAPAPTEPVTPTTKKNKGKGERLRIDGKNFFFRMHERTPSKPIVWSVDVNGQERFLQKLDDQWFEVQKNNEGQWQSVNESLGSNQAEATENLVSTYVPKAEPEVLEESEATTDPTPTDVEETTEVPQEETITEPQATTQPEVLEAHEATTDPNAPAPEEPTVADKIFDQTRVQSVIDFIEKLKYKGEDGTLNVFGPIFPLYNLALSTIQAAIKTGNSLYNAMGLGIDFLRDNLASDEEIEEFTATTLTKLREGAKSDPELAELLKAYDKEKKKVSVKRTIKDSVDRRAMETVTMRKIDAIKRQMRDWERGYRAGTAEERKAAKDRLIAELKALDDERRTAFEEYHKYKTEQTKAKLKAQQEKYEQKLNDYRTKVADKAELMAHLGTQLKMLLDNIDRFGLFKGHQMSQNRAMKMIKAINEAATKGSVAKMKNAVQYIGNHLADMDYRNKLSDAKKNRRRIRNKMYFKGVQPVVDGFLAIDPENLALDDLYEYMQLQEELIEKYKAAKSGNTIFNTRYTPAEFDYLRDFSMRAMVPSTTIADDTDTDTGEDVNPTGRPNPTLWEQIKDWGKTFQRRMLDFRRGMPKHMYHLRELMEGGIARQTKMAVITATRISKLLDAAKVHDPGIVKVFDKALRGDIEQLNLLPDPLRQGVERMRQHLDALSQSLIDNGFVSPSEAANIESHLGQYLNRSFELFQNKHWTLENVKHFYNPIYMRALTYLTKQYYEELKAKSPLHGSDVALATPAELRAARAAEAEMLQSAENRAEADIAKFFDKKTNPFVNNKKVGSLDLSILDARKDIEAPLRALFGEVTDPVYNYVNTIYKVASLAESNRFLHTIKDLYGTMGMPQQMFWHANDPNRPATAYKQIAAEGTETFGPLKGMYTTPELFDAFETRDFPLPEWLRWVAKIQGYIKMGKTFYSPVTHFKNIEGNISILIQNGMLPIGKVGEAFQALVDDYKHADTDAMNEVILPLIEAGLLKQDITSNEMKLIFSESHPSDVAFERRFGRERTNWEKSMATLAKLHHRGVAAAYMAEDDFFKIIAFLHDRERYADALFNKKFKDLLPEEKQQVTHHVVDILKNTIPNFSRVPDIARAGGMLFGNFVSFASESFRTEWNQWAQINQELRSENKKIRIIGAKRMAGMVANKAWKAGIVKAGIGAVGGMLGYLFDDEEEKRLTKDVQRIVPGWSRNSDLIILKFQDGILEYVDYSSYDPFGAREKAMNAFANGESLDEGMVNMIMELAAPFAEPEMTITTAYRMLANQNGYGGRIFNPEDTWTMRNYKRAAYVVKTLQPGITAFAGKLIYPKNYTVGEIMTSLVVKKIKLDLKDQASYRFRDYDKRVEDIYKIYTSNRSYRSKQVDPEDTAAAFRRANEQLDALIGEMHQDYRAFLRGGVPAEDLDEMLSKYASGLAEAIRTNDPDLYDFKSK